MSVESNKEALRSGYEAFNRQDIPAPRATFDEHIAWTEPEWTYGQIPEGTIYGRDEVLRQIFQPVGESYDAFEVDPSTTTARATWWSPRAASGCGPRA